MDTEALKAMGWNPISDGWPEKDGNYLLLLRRRDAQKYSASFECIEQLISSPQSAHHEYTYGPEYWWQSTGTVFASGAVSIDCWEDERQQIVAVVAWRDLPPQPRD